MLQVALENGRIVLGVILEGYYGDVLCRRSN